MGSNTSNLGNLQTDLNKLKECYEQGLLTKSIYDDAREKLLHTRINDKTWWEKLLKAAISPILIALIDSIMKNHYQRLLTER